MSLCCSALKINAPWTDALESTTDRGTGPAKSPSQDAVLVSAKIRPGT